MEPNCLLKNRHQNTYNFYSKSFLLNLIRKLNQRNNISIISIVLFLLMKLLNFYFIFDSINHYD